MSIYANIQKVAAWVKAGNKDMLSMSVNELVGVDYEEALQLFEGRVSDSLGAEVRAHIENAQ